MAETNSRDLRLERWVEAPPGLVFEAFTKAEHLVHWWAPKPFTTPKCKVDLRPGGYWRYTFRSPEGLEHDCVAIYKEVDPPRKLVLESSVPGKDGKPLFTIRQSIVFTAEGKGTALLFEVKVLEANPGSEPYLGGMEAGTNMTLDNLLEYAGKMEK